MVNNVITKRQVFLGGTCNGDTWRDELIPMLKVPYFNPIVEDWNEECIKREEEEKLNSKIELYVLTSKMTGIYSVAECFYSLCCKKDKKTILCILTDGFTESQLKSINATAELFKKATNDFNNNGNLCFSLKEVADICNSYLQIY